MFARKTAPATGVSAPSSAAPSGLAGQVAELRERIGPVLANPFVGAGAAAVLFVSALGILVLVTADPKAGLPFVRMKLEDRVAEVNKMSGPGGFSVDGLKPDAFVDPGAPPVDGQAIVTLPQGGQMIGGQSATPGQPATAAGPAPGTRYSTTPLPSAPMAGLTEPSPVGLLPVISKDGRAPYQAYARPFQPNGKPRVALVVGGLGLNASATKAAIERLPPEITLSFVAYSDGLQGWIDMARANGHEVLLEAPMEPLDAAANDPGPYALKANGSNADTVKRLEWILARCTGYFGVTNYLGGKFLTADAPVLAFEMALRQRGVAFVDDGAAARRTLPGLPRASADTGVDADLAAESIQKQLIALEQTASQRGQALGSAFAYPLTLEVANRWAAGLAARGYQLAPVSALTRR